MTKTRVRKRASRGCFAALFGRFCQFITLIDPLQFLFRGSRRVERYERYGTFRACAQPWLTWKGRPPPPPTQLGTRDPAENRRLDPLDRRLGFVPASIVALTTPSSSRRPGPIRTR